MPGFRMSTYQSTASMTQIADRLRQAKRIMITTHAKPDGDALGSAMALRRALTAMGKSADVFLAGPFEPSLMSLAESTPYHDVAKGMPGTDYDAAIIVDTGAWTQLDPIAPWLRAHAAITLGVDHHARGNDVASLRWIDSTAVSTTALLIPLLESMDVKLTGEIGGVAEALFIGLATDSGWFRHDNADAKAFSLAAKLLGVGVNKSRLYQIIEETHRPQRLALEARALTSIEYLRGGTVALQTLCPDDFEASGGSPEDLTGVVNLPMSIGAVRLSILISQSPPTATTTNPTKVSFRSKPPPPGGAADDFIDVNKLAATFGGGGHVHAAGAKINAGIDEARTMVLAALDF